MGFMVIKCGGSVFDTLPDSFFQQVVGLQRSGEWMPILVHGGGPAISQMLKALDIPTTFVNGLRVTTPEVLDTVEMVLSGRINKQMVRKLKQCGGKAIGLSGVDGELLVVKQVADQQLGLVGEVVQVNSPLIKSLTEQGLIPVISPIGSDEQGTHYNVNADTAAAAIAGALKAPLCFVSDIPGIYVEEDGEQHVLSQASKAHLEALIQEQVITGGMVPKVEAALTALTQQAPEVVILDGTDESALLRFSQGEPVGTRIVLEGALRYGKGAVLHG